MSVSYNFGDKLRTVRKRRGVTLKTVAAQANVSESLISQIERNKVSPAIDTLLRIAEILGIDMDYLFRDLRKPQHVNIVRYAEREQMKRDGVTYERLSRTPETTDEHGIEAYYMEIEPGNRSGSDEYGHKGKELGTIISGQGQFTIGNEVIDLLAGDSLSFASDVPHHLENTGAETLRAFWTITPPKQ